MNNSDINFAASQVKKQVEIIRELNRKYQAACNEFDKVIEETKDIIQEVKQRRGTAQNNRDNLKRYLNLQQGELRRMTIHKKLLLNQHQIIDKQKKKN